MIEFIYGPINEKTIGRYLKKLLNIKRCKDNFVFSVNLLVFIYYNFTYYYNLLFIIYYISIG